jgi:hypothetical protein
LCPICPYANNCSINILSSATSADLLLLPCLKYTSNLLICQLRYTSQTLSPQKTTKPQKVRRRTFVRLSG